MDKVLLEKYMRSLKGGEIDALDGIYALTSRSVYLLAYSILKSSEKAKDIMQDTFVRAAANIDKYSAGTNAYAWLLKIARNLSYREFTNSGRTASLEALEDSLPDNSNSDVFWTDSIDLNNAMSKLSVQEREVVTLYSLEGYKHREIAQITGRPLGTVLWLYNKAIKKLKKLLEKQQ